MLSPLTGGVKCQPAWKARVWPWGRLRVYIRVRISPQGQILGTIPTPVGMQSVGFAGRDKKTMFAVGRGAAYKISMLAEGIPSRAK